MKNLFPALLLSLGIAVAGTSIAYAIYTFKNFDHYVAVKGLAEKTVKANDAIWQIRINSVDDDLTAIYQQATAAQDKIARFLLEQGFLSQEIERQSINVEDRQAQSYNADNKHLKRYIATTGVVLHTSSVDKVIAAQQKVSSLVQQGVMLNKSTVSYYFTDLNAIKPSMLNEATLNAKKAAELFAQNSHSAIGKIRSASQGFFDIQDSVQSDEYRPNSSVMKNIRVVTSIEYFLQ